MGVDPLGLAEWCGNEVVFSGGEVFGLAYLTGSLYSPLDNGNYMMVNVSGVFGGTTAGIPAGFSAGKLRGSDRFAEVFPYSFESKEFQSAIAGVNLSTPMGGASYSAATLGHVVFQPEGGFAIGSDASISMMLGTSEVRSFSEVSSEYAEQKGCECTQ